MPLIWAAVVRVAASFDMSCCAPQSIKGWATRTSSTGCHMMLHAGLLRQRERVYLSGNLVAVDPSDPMVIAVKHNEA